MAQRIPDNLSILYEAFGQDAIDGILSGDTFTVGDTEFVCQYIPDSTSSRFSIVKPMELVDRYRELCEWARGGNILELGIAEGGSTALMALWAEPAKLVSIDLEPNRLEVLDEFIARHGLQTSVVPLYGVDQADDQALQAIVAEHFGDEPLDLVIDDASHKYGPTKASFMSLLPHLRTGGRYIIEDWESDTAMHDAVATSMVTASAEERERFAQAIRDEMTGKTPAPPPRTPLIRLALEITLACAGFDRCISEVSLNKSFVDVVRSDLVIDPSTFEEADLYVDYAGLLAAETL